MRRVSALRRVSICIRRQNLRKAEILRVIRRVIRQPGIPAADITPCARSADPHRQRAGTYQDKTPARCRDCEDCAHQGSENRTLMRAKMVGPGRAGLCGNSGHRSHTGRDSRPRAGPADPGHDLPTRAGPAAPGRTWPRYRRSPNRPGQHRSQEQQAKEQLDLAGPICCRRCRRRRRPCRTAPAWAAGQW
jgi:hypothetical protein